MSLPYIQEELQMLERLCLKHPKKAMEMLSLRGVDRFLALYKEVSGIELVGCRELDGSSMVEYHEA